MSDETNNKSFCLVLKAINEVSKRTDNTLEDIFIYFHWSVLSVEALIGYNNMTL